MKSIYTLAIQTKDAYLHVHFASCPHKPVLGTHNDEVYLKVFINAWWVAISYCGFMLIFLYIYTKWLQLVTAKHMGDWESLSDLPHYAKILIIKLT